MLARYLKRRSTMVFQTRNFCQFQLDPIKASAVSIDRYFQIQAMPFDKCLPYLHPTKWESHVPKYQSEAMTYVEHLINLLLILKSHTNENYYDTFMSQNKHVFEQNNNFINYIEEKFTNFDTVSTDSGLGPITEFDLTHTSKMMDELDIKSSDYLQYDDQFSAETKQQIFTMSGIPENILYILSEMDQHMLNDDTFVKQLPALPDQYYCMLKIGLRYMEYVLYKDPFVDINSSRYIEISFATDALYRAFKQFEQKITEKANELSFYEYSTPYDNVCKNNNTDFVCDNEVLLQLHACKESIVVPQNEQVEGNDDFDDEWHESLVMYRSLMFNFYLCRMFLQAFQAFYCKEYIDVYKQIVDDQDMWILQRSLRELIQEAITNNEQYSNDAKTIIADKDDTNTIDFITKVAKQQNEVLSAIAASVDLILKK